MDGLSPLPKIPPHSSLVIEKLSQYPTSNHPLPTPFLATTGFLGNTPRIPARNANAP